MLTLRAPFRQEILLRKLAQRTLTPTEMVKVNSDYPLKRW